MGCCWPIIWDWKLKRTKSRVAVKKPNPKIRPKNAISR